MGSGCEMLWTRLSQCEAEEAGCCLAHLFSAVICGYVCLGAFAFVARLMAMLFLYTLLHEENRKLVKARILHYSLYAVKC